MFHHAHPFDGRALAIVVAMLFALAYLAYWERFTRSPDRETDPDYVHPHNDDYVGRFEHTPAFDLVDIGKGFGALNWVPIERHPGGHAD